MRIAVVVLQLVIKLLLDSKARKKKPNRTLSVLLLAIKLCKCRPAINCVNADNHTTTCKDVPLTTHTPLKMPKSGGQCQKILRKLFAVPSSSSWQTPAGTEEEEDEWNIEAVNGYHWRSDRANSICRFCDIAQGGLEPFEQIPIFD